VTLGPGTPGPIGIFYATREGHTRTIAEHIAIALRARGLAAIVCDVATPEPGAVVRGLGLAILAASIHMGRHEQEMLGFVRSHRTDLEAIPTAFLSVSLSERTVEDDEAAPVERERADVVVREMIDTFFQEAGWMPTRFLPVAGCVAYTRYGVVKRFFMKRIVRAAHGPLDTSRDHDLTDWASLDAFVAAMVAVAERNGVRLSHAAQSATG
jgi:menaquinone-dependent protoporphyrinogen oxidase